MKSGTSPLAASPNRSSMADARALAPALGRVAIIIARRRPRPIARRGAPVAAFVALRFDLEPAQRVAADCVVHHERLVLAAEPGVQAPVRRPSRQRRRRHVRDALQVARLREPAVWPRRQPAVVVGPLTVRRRGVLAAVDDRPARPPLQLHRQQRGLARARLAFDKLARLGRVHVAEAGEDLTAVSSDPRGLRVAHGGLVARTQRPERIQATPPEALPLQRGALCDERPRDPLATDALVGHDGRVARVELPGDDLCHVHFIKTAVIFNGSDWDTRRGPGGDAQRVAGDCDEVPVPRRGPCPRRRW
eukprot:4719132-Prymnesium_polylepis.1